MVTGSKYALHPLFDVKHKLTSQSCSLQNSFLFAFLDLFWYFEARRRVIRTGCRFCLFVLFWALQSSEIESTVWIGSDFQVCKQKGQTGKRGRASVRQHRDKHTGTRYDIITTGIGIKQIHR
jgi:hypothetical protein